MKPRAGVDSIVAAASIPAGRCRMTQAPDIRGEGRYLVGSKLRPAHRRHGAAIFFGLRHSIGDRFRDSGVAAIAPQPFLAPSDRAPMACPYRSRHGNPCSRSAHLAVVDAIAQRNHLSCRSFGNGKIAALQPHRRLDGCPPAACAAASTGLAGRSRCARAGSDLRGVVSSTAVIDDSVDSSAHVVGNVERAVRPDGQAGGTMRGVSSATSPLPRNRRRIFRTGRMRGRRRAAEKPRCSRLADMAPDPMNRGRR